MPNNISNFLHNLVPTQAGGAGLFASGTVTTTAKTLTTIYGGQFNADTRVVQVTIENANVRIRADGQSPTTSVGLLYTPGIYQFSVQYAAIASFIATSGTATINIEELAPCTLE